MCVHAQRQIDIKIWNYSKKPGLSNVRGTIRSAVDDFPNLSNRIGKLYVFVFNSKQVEEGVDIERMRSHIGLPRGKLKGWDLMCSDWNKDIGLIEVRIEEFNRSSDTRRKFIARHELGHVFLSGPPSAVTLQEVSIDSRLKDTFYREVYKILIVWQEYKVDSLMARLFPELTIQYMYENPAGYSQTEDRKRLNRCQTPFKKLLFAIRLMIICETQLAILKEIPSSLRKKMWKSIRRLHSERIEPIKHQTLQIRPKLRDFHAWFTEEHFENPELLIRRVLELSSPS